MPAAMAMGLPEFVPAWKTGPAGMIFFMMSARPPTACLSTVQFMLKGSEALRQMQMNAIHNTQNRTSRLSSSLAHATGPLDTGKAWQQFSQDNLQKTIEYWSACREILQDTEFKMLNSGEKSISKNAKDVEPQARLVKPAKRYNATKARAHRTASASH